MSAARYLVLHGAAGRMGQSILRLLPESSLKLGAALVRPGSAWVGESIADHVSGAKVDQEFLDALDPDAECSVLMDFSHGESFSAALELARYRGAEPPEIAYSDVVITRSPPGVRDYSGEKSAGEQK